jgi:ferredoxin-type protein NapH
MHRDRIKKKRRGRLLVQTGAALGSNAYLAGFFTGSIFQGPTKYVCLPGLNCYSCPGAIGACPIGALQNVLASAKYSISLYVTGTLLLFGLALGRWICGWLCPFGWIQDLLHRIPSKKIKVPKRFSCLRFIKYAVLAALVILLPSLIANSAGQGDPWFCKYVCPSGTTLGALPLIAASEQLRGLLGDLFILKASIAAAILILSVFLHRVFCRYLCPLGAIYGLLNKLSFYRMRLEERACTNCGTCASVCRMGVEPNKTPNSCECIRCGDCVASCPHGALSMGFKQSEKRREEHGKTFV